MSQAEVGLSALKPVWRQRRDNLFVLARAHGRPRYYYPDGLYIATQGIQRITDSEVIVGVNDVGHFGRGWWSFENDSERGYRWTTERARVSLALPEQGCAELVIEANALAAALGPTTVTLRAGDRAVAYRLDDDQWRELILPLQPEPKAQRISFDIEVAPLRSMQAAGFNTDNRLLGVMVRRLTVR